MAAKKKKMGMVDRARKAMPAYDRAIIKTADVMEGAGKAYRNARDTFFTDKDVRAASEKVKQAKRKREEQYM